MSSTNRHHQFGVHGQPVDRTWPAITPTDLKALSAFYPVFRHENRILIHAPRPFSSACLVQASEATYFVKRHDTRLKSPCAIAQEHHFLAWVARQGASVIQPCGNSHGETVTASLNWVYEVYPAAQGVDIYRDTHSWEGWLSLDHARSAGSALGSLHNLSQGYTAPPRRGVRLTSSMDFLREGDPIGTLDRLVAQLISKLPMLGADHATYQNARGLLIRFLEALEPFLRWFPPCWGHGDWHGSNLMWRDASASAEVEAIFDFGMANQTATLFDFAVAVERSNVSWLNPDPAQWRVRWSDLEAFALGYQASRPISLPEYAAVAAILPFVHIAFALSEVAYYAEVVGDIDSARVAYDTYFLGHITWMAQSEGMKLRRFIASELPDRIRRLT